MSDEIVVDLIPDDLSLARAQLTAGLVGQAEGSLAAAHRAAGRRADDGRGLDELDAARALLAEALWRQGRPLAGAAVIDAIRAGSLERRRPIVLLVEAEAMAAGGDPDRATALMERVIEVRRRRRGLAPAGRRPVAPAVADARLHASHPAASLDAHVRRVDHDGRTEPSVARAHGGRSRPIGGGARSPTTPDATTRGIGSWGWPCGSTRASRARAWRWRNRRSGRSRHRIACCCTATCCGPPAAARRRRKRTTAPPAPEPDSLDSARPPTQQEQHRSMERTLVLVKPDGVQRGLIGEIVARFERKGLKVVGLRLLTVPREMAERHYAVHAGKHFYDGLVEFITSGPVAAVALEGPDAIATVRRLVGATMPNEANPGTIRGDLGISGLRNLIHASDAAETAARRAGAVVRRGRSARLRAGG